MNNAIIAKASTIKFPLLAFLKQKPHSPMKSKEKIEVIIPKNKIVSYTYIFPISVVNTKHIKITKSA